jgi:thiamine kinase-like enzyme
LLTEYAEGDVWRRSDLDDDDQLDRLADTLRRLHALPLTGRRFDAVAAADTYIREIGDAHRGAAKRFHAAIRAAPVRSELRCCHNDLVAANILYADGVRLLDWEYACDNDPLFDLATIVAHHRLRTRQARRLLDAYFDDGGVRWRKRLAEQQIVYDALTWLWQAAEAANGRPPDNNEKPASERGKVS